MRRVNVSIDDVTPHPHSSIRVVEKCFRILDRVPSAKFTLFVPTAYWRTIPSPPQSMCSAPLRLSENLDFCEQLARLPQESFEIGFHGHHHGIPGKSNNDELKSVSFDEARRIYSLMMHEVVSAGMNDYFKMILRPPAWRLSKEAFDAADGVFDLLALNPDPAYESVYAGAQWSDRWKDRIVYQDTAPPIVPFPDTWEALEIVTHACEWDKNFLSNDLADSICDLMSMSNAVGSFIGDLRGKV
jgi:hypothetical protein